MSPLLAERQKPLEDPLVYLPCSRIAEYKKGQTIYNHGQQDPRLYLIVEGAVKISRLSKAGTQVVFDVYHRDEFFGEFAFLCDAARGDAEAVQNTKVMSWTALEIEDFILNRPVLGIAFMQILANRSFEFTERIESFACDTITRRLAGALIRFCERLGEATEAGDGSYRMLPLTHELLGQYVGTSREIMTHYMNQFRRQGYVTYSRRELIVFPERLKKWLNQNLKIAINAAPLSLPAR